MISCVKIGKEGLRLLVFNFARYYIILYNNDCFFFFFFLTVYILSALKLLICKKNPYLPSHNYIIST